MVWLLALILCDLGIPEMDTASPLAFHNLEDWSHTRKSIAKVLTPGLPVPLVASLLVCLAHIKRLGIKDFSKQVKRNANESGFQTSGCPSRGGK